MLDPGAECPECGGKLGASASCRACGWKPTEATVKLPAYREFKPRELRRAAPSETCPECGRPVREHIEEAKRIAGSAEWATRFGTQRG